MGKYEAKVSGYKKRPDDLQLFWWLQLKILSTQPRQGQREQLPWNKLKVGPLQQFPCRQFNKTRVAVSFLKVWNSPLNAECYILDIYGDWLLSFYYAEGLEIRTCLQPSHTTTECWIWTNKLHYAWWL